jgi:hypothetical protein
MAQALAVAGVAGTLMKGAGTILSGYQQAKEDKSEANQLDAAAGQERASSQRQGMEEQRQSQLVQSRALALAAAGGGASDPTVVNDIANIAGEGEYRSLTALYNGDQQARTYEAKATGLRKEAKNAKLSGWINGVGSILQSGSSMAQRYG